MTNTPAEGQSPSQFDSSNLIMFLLKWRKPLIIICAAAAAVSAVVSLVMTEKYRSTVVMFPSAATSVSQRLLAENPVGKKDILQFGEEEDAEQLLQILNSDQIRNRVKDRFGLMKHYDIDSSESYRETKFIKKYEDHFKFKRTEFQSVRVDVLDRDKDTAAAMANYIGELVDTVMTMVQRQRSLKALKIVKDEYNDLAAEIKWMEDSITRLRKIGVHEYEVQVEMYTEYYSKAVTDGKTAAAEKLAEKLDLLGKYGSAYVTLRDRMEHEVERLSILRSKLREAEVEAEQELPHVFIVDHAFAADKKYKPIRWLIVTISTFAAFLLGIVIIIAFENWKRFKASEK